MLSAVIKEKLAARATELDEIQNRIAALTDEKREAAAAVQAAVEQKIVDEIIAARQNEARLDEQIQALKLVQAEIAKGHPVDHDVFQTEYAGFFAQQQQDLDKTYRQIVDKLTELEPLYLMYETAYSRYAAALKPWQDLAAKIGADRPAELRSQILNPAHGDIKRALARLRMTGGF